MRRTRRRREDQPREAVPPASAGSGAAPDSPFAEAATSTAAPVPQDEPAAVWVPIGALRPWDRNPRDNTQAIEQVARSIRRFGFASPIIARKADGEIIAGHTRYAAAKLLGFDRVPVRFLDLDPADAHLLALADNRLGEIAEWTSELAEILRDARAEDRGGLGWSDEELAKLLDESGADTWGAGGGGAPDQSDMLSAGKFQIVVDCIDEAHQGVLLEQFTREGLPCRALMT